MKTPIVSDEIVQELRDKHWPAGGKFDVYAFAQEVAVAAVASQGRAINAVISERRRQQQDEGWSIEHDDRHDPGTLAGAGAAYALNASCVLYPYNGTPLDDPTLVGWLWGIEWWKPKDPRRDLERAAALIIAEIERIDRAGDDR